MEYEILRKLDEMAIEGQREARIEDIMMKLADEHKREKELVLKKMAQVETQIETKLEKKRALELETVIIKRVVEVMKRVIGDGDGEANKRLECMEQLLKDKEEELEEIQ